MQAVPAPFPVASLSQCVCGACCSASPGLVWLHLAFEGYALDGLCVGGGGEDGLSYHC